MATRAQITVDGTAGSNDDITLNTLVQLNNNGLGDEATYEWTIVSQPSGSPNAVLSDASIQAPTFTANKEGSYLVELIVNKDLIDQKVDRVVVAVRELETRNRIPAAYETIENNAETGWANTAVDQILQRVTRFADQGVIVGTVGEAGLVPLDVVYVSDVTTIATGLPGEREVPLWDKASAASQATVSGLLGVLLGGVNGSPAPAVGSLVRVAVLKLVRSVDLGTTGEPDGTPVYVDDAGKVSLTPGTIIRQIGTTIDEMGSGSYGIWVTGEGTFGTIQGVAVQPPLTVVTGTIPELGLDYDANNLRVVADALDLTETPVTAGTYGDGAPTYPDEPASLIPQFTVDEYGRLTAAGQAGATIGGIGAKTYVDNGDAATLAAANSYTDAKSYGLSSKLPVQAATTTALPANTANAGFTTLTANVHGPLPAIDDHSMVVGERLLVKNEGTQTNNGIYVVTQLGASSGPSSPWILTRAADADTAIELCGSLVTVNTGSTNAGSAWIFAYNPALFTLGTTPVIWTQFNAVPATDTVLGTVQLTGALGGTGSLATAPVMAVGTGYVSGVLPVANGGTGISAAGAAGHVLVSDGSAWASSEVPAAQAAVTGGVRIAGALAGTASTALLPVVALGTGYVSGTLPATHGGTGLNSSGASSLALLAADGSGGWQLRSTFLTNSILSGYVTNPTGLQTGTFFGYQGLIPLTRAPGTSAGYVHLTSEGGVLLKIGPNTWSAPFPLIGGAVRLEGEDTQAVNGTGGIASLDGGSGADGGDAQISGGSATAGLGGTGVGGAALVRAGDSVGTQSGGTTTVRGGNADAALEATGGIVEVYGGAGFDGGDVKLYGGAGSVAARAGWVRISKRPGFTGGGVTVDDAYVNGTGTVGQVFTSRGAALPPEWAALGGAPGPAAQGAFRTVSSAYTVTLNDFALYGLFGSPSYTVTLPVASGVPAGRMFIIKSATSTGVVTLAAAAGEQIDVSNGPWPLAQFETRRVMRTSGVGSEWMFI